MNQSEDDINFKDRLSRKIFHGQLPQFDMLQIAKCRPHFFVFMMSFQHFYIAFPFINLCHQQISFWHGHINFVCHENMLYITMSYIFIMEQCVSK